MIIDIHSHIIPEIDDGSKDMDMSMEMAKLYVENGITKVIATPHYIKKSSMSSEYKDNLEKIKLLRQELKKKNIDLEVYLGNEVYISNNILEDLKNEKITTLNKSRYILIEFPMMDIPISAEEIFYEIQIEGYIPILAHPERNYKVIEDPNILYNFIKKGCLVQMNIPSLEGKYGKDIKTTAERLVSCDMIHFIGADSHSSIRRTPNISRGLEELKKLVGEEKYKDICINNPTNVLNNKDIKILEPKEYKKEFSFTNLFR